MAKILSGCTVLEHLTLYQCDDELKVLDLRESLRLRTLDVIHSVSNWGQTQILAPHIYCLRLFNSQFPSTTLVDVASLTEANLENIFYYGRFKADFHLLQVNVLEMLEKLQNAEKLTLGRKFIQILSLAEIRGVPFPMLKVKALTLDTDISQYVIPGIERLLQNVPGLEKLTVRGRARVYMPDDEYLDKYLELQGFNVNKCWRSKDGASWYKCYVYAKSKDVASFVQLMLKNTKKLDKMVVLLDKRFLKFETGDLAAKLSKKNNVTIVLSATTEW